MYPDRKALEAEEKRCLLFIGFMAGLVVGLLLAWMR
jgi:hypothetical protein